MIWHTKTGNRKMVRRDKNVRHADLWDMGIMGSWRILKAETKTDWHYDLQYGRGRVFSGKRQLVVYR